MHEKRADSNATDHKDFLDADAQRGLMGESGTEIIQGSAEQESNIAGDGCSNRAACHKTCWKTWIFGMDRFTVQGMLLQHEHHHTAQKIS